MAAAAAEPRAENPCCARWKEKWSKAAEGRAHLKEAISVLEKLANKLQKDNVALKEVCEKERDKADKEREGKEKEVALRVSLENEISSMRQKENAEDKNIRDELKLLKDCVSQGEKNIEQLKKLLEKEKMRADSEKKKAEVEKKSAGEAWKLVKSERAKIDEERKHANLEGKKAEELRLQLEAVKKEAHEAKSKMDSQTLMLDNVKCDLEAEKQKVAEQRNLFDLEMVKVELQKKCVEELEKNVMVEKSRADGLSLQLEDARRKIEDLQMAVNKPTISQSSGVDCSSQRDDILNADTGSWLESLMKDEDMSDLVLHFEDSDDAMKMIEVEKEKALTEKKRANMEMAKAEEKSKLAEASKKIAAEEKSRADQLLVQLQEKMRIIEELQKQIQELLCCKTVVGASAVLHDKHVDAENAKIKLLEERLDIKQKAALLEKERADSVVEKVEEYKNLAEVHRKMAMEEKAHSEKLSLELEKHRHKIGELEKQMQELESTKKNFLEEQLNLEKKWVVAEKERADSEMKKLEEYKLLAEVHRKVAMEEKAHSEKLSLELEKERHKIGELEKQMQELESTKIKLLEEHLNLEKKVVAEKERADSEMKKLEECKLLAEGHRKVAIDEKAHSEKLSTELEKHRHKIGELEKQMQELENTKIKLLEEQLNLEKKKVMAEKKHADSEMKKLEEHKLLAEGHRKVAMEEKAHSKRLSLELGKQRHKIGDLEKQIQELESTKIKLLEEQLNLERKNVVAEKERADSEMKKVEEYKIIAEEHRKVAAEEKAHSVRMALELEKDRQKIGEMEKQMQELWSCRNSVKECAISPEEDMNVRVKKRKSTEDGLGVEKQGLVQDKKGTFFHGVEAGKYRHLVEENKKMATEENVCAEQLSLQIREDRLRIDEMQRQIELLLSSQRMARESVVLSVKKSNSKNPKVKLLEKQLKLEKKRLKFAKQVAETEKGRNRFLEQELNRLKLDFIQILCRLDLLGKICSPSIEAAKDIGKAAELAHEKGSKMRNLAASVPLYAQNVNNPVDSSCMANVASDYLSQTCQYTDPSNAVRGRNLGESISGIDSKLEPVLGCSKQKLFPTFAMNSSSASFSDAQLAGSQDRDAFITAPQKLGEENVDMQLKISDMSGEVTGLQKNDNLAVVVEDGIRHPQKIDVFGDVNGSSGKMRFPDSSKSIENLDTEAQGLLLPMQEEVDVFHGMSKRQIEEQKSLEDMVQGCMNPDQERFQRKRESSHELISVVQHTPCGNGIDKTDNTGDKVLVDPNSTTNASLFANDPIGASRECLSDSLQYHLETFARFEDVKDDNYIRLLELDNAAEEESYRRAAEMPLSPTLPEVVLPDADLSDMSSYRNQMPISPNSKLEDSIVELRIRHAETFRTDCPELMSVSKVASACDELQTTSPMFPNISDCGSLSRVLYASRRWLASCPLEADTGSLLKKILHDLKKQKTSTKERSAVLFTLLLQHFLTCNLAKDGKFLGVDFHSHMDAFSKKIIIALKDNEVKSLFAEVLCLDELLGTIEHFLLDGRGMCYVDPSSIMGEYDSRLDIVVDDENISLFSKSASVEQLVVGGIILVSICVVTDHIGFLCEASYNLLRVCKGSDSDILIILHVFAHLGGEEFFSQQSCRLTMTVLKSMVMHLETSNSSRVSASHSAADDVVGLFHSFDKCPFQSNELGIDMAAKILLKRLCSSIFSEMIDEHVLESADSSCRMVCHRDKARHDESSTHCDESCCSTKVHDDPTGMVTSRALFDLSDILSLLELLASKMSWEWTCNIVIPELLEMLKRPMLDSYVISVLALLGQLGSLGVTSCGYEDKGVENIRHKLSSFLWWWTTVGVALPVQIATVAALLGLLTVDFQQVVQGNLKLTGTGGQSVSADLIGNWFSLLSKEQQTLASGLLQPADPTMN